MIDIKETMKRSEECLAKHARCICDEFDEKGHFTDPQQVDDLKDFAVATEKMERAMAMMATK